jgi:hypothetical protein
LSNSFLALIGDSYVSGKGLGVAATEVAGPVILRFIYIPVDFYGRDARVVARA